MAKRLRLEDAGHQGGPRTPGPGTEVTIAVALASHRCALDAPAQDGRRCLGPQSAIDRPDRPTLCLPGERDPGRERERGR